MANGEASQTVEWSTQDGRPAVVTISIVAGFGPTYTASVAGKRVGETSNPKLANPITTRGVTVVGKIGDLALTQDRLDLVLAARDELMSTLPGRVTTRKQMAERLALLLEMDHDAATDRIEHASATGIDSGRADLSGRIAALEHALADFDAVNPDVVAYLEDERRESVARFEAID